MQIENGEVARNRGAEGLTVGEEALDDAGWWRVGGLRAIKMTKI
jgi:hypothetical protein